MSREMKDSGIEWIGKIPKTWRVCRLKDVGALYGGLIGKSGEDFNVDEEDSSYMLYVPFTNIFNNDSINSKQLYKVKVEQGEKQNLVQKGDLLFLMSSEDYDGIGKPAIMEEQIDNLGLNSFCKGLRVSDSDTNSKYLFYLLSSHILRELVRQEAKGFIRINLRQDRLSCCSIFLPPLSEQQKIEDYLDKVCGEIDDMIALQEKMIEELKAYKQSVITEAVTKGLNPNVPMRDSGIDWIGEIPEGWEITKILNMLSMPITDGPHETPQLYESGIPFISAEAVSGGEIDFQHMRGYISKEYYDECCKKYIPAIDDIYMIKSGATTGRTAIVKTNILFTIWSPLAVLRANKKRMLPYYLFYYLKSSSLLKQVENYWTYGTQQNIGMRTLEKLKICVPPLSEQRQIANYLDQKCTEIDELLTIKQQKIEELKEYKKSIIYEYVTGKKQVN